MMNFTPELVEKAKAAQTAEELLELAKAAGVEMTAAEAAAYFAQLNPKTGELSDDDLDAVAGGACSNKGNRVRVTSGETCKKCGGNIGIMETYYQGGYILCENCYESIAYPEYCTYEFID